MRTKLGSNTKKEAKKRIGTSLEFDRLRANVRRKFNKFIQLRDLIKTPSGKIIAHCISCEREKIIESSYQLKEFHAGHYFKEDRHESVALDEINVNGQCGRCNRYLNGNESAYEENLRIKYGDEEFENLRYRKNQIKKYSYGELQELDRIYSQKIKDEQKRLGQKW